MTCSEESPPVGPEQLSRHELSLKDMGTCCVPRSLRVIKAKAVATNTEFSVRLVRRAMYLIAQFFSSHLGGV